MFFQMIYAAFSWLPPPLYMLVYAVFVFFWVVCLYQAIRVIAELVKFLVDIFGGVVSKVVTFFVGI